MTFAELAAFAGRHPMLSLALAGITIALIGNELANLLGGVRRLFLTVIRRRSKNRHSVARPTPIPCSPSRARNSFEAIRDNSAIPKSLGFGGANTDISSLRT